MKKHLTLISGYARSGKDTLAQALVDELAKAGKEAVVVKFANPLKRALQIGLNEVGLGHIDVFTEDPALKAMLRPLMVEFGRYARSQDKDVFAKAAVRDAEALLEQGKDAVVISDCRYLNEAQVARSWGEATGNIVDRLLISVPHQAAANDEEANSLLELNKVDISSRRRFFALGDVAGIKAWARDLVSGEGPMPEWLRTGTAYPLPFTAEVKVPSNEMLEQVIGLKLALERLNARVRRLEGRDGA
jgi:phosphomevalonate kinase